VFFRNEIREENSTLPASGATLYQRSFAKNLLDFIGSAFAWNRQKDRRRTVPSFYEFFAGAGMA
jgi:hypothetical protein